MWSSFSIGPEIRHGGRRRAVRRRRRPRLLAARKHCRSSPDRAQAQTRGPWRGARIPGGRSAALQLLDQAFDFLTLAHGIPPLLESCRRHRKASSSRPVAGSVVSAHERQEPGKAVKEGNRPERSPPRSGTSPSPAAPHPSGCPDRWPAPRRGRNTPWRSARRPSRPAWGR